MRLVAIAQRCIQRVKRAFGYAPRTARCAALFLDIDAEARRFVQQTVPRQRQEKLRHQILEHRARPAGHAAVAAGGAHHARQSAPVTPRHVAPCNGRIARKPRLAGHEVVKPRRGQALFEIDAYVHQTAPEAVEYRKVHAVEKRPHASGKLAEPLRDQPAVQSRETCAQVPAVDRGQVFRLEGAQRARIVPVAQMPAEARQALYSAEHAADKAYGALKAYYPELLRTHGRAQRKPDVRRRGPVREPDRRLLLKIVRRQEIVLRGAAGVEAAPYILCAAEKIAPLLRRGLVFLFRRQGEGKRGDWRKAPQKPRSFGEYSRGEQNKAQPRYRREPHAF